MSTDAHYHLRDIDIDLADLPRVLYDEIVSLHGQVEHPPAPPTFTCLGNGAPMYIVHNAHGRYFLRHYPNKGCGHAHALSTISDEHRRQAEYGLRAATRHGLDANLEVSTGGGTRVDVGVITPKDRRVGFEIQRSELSRAHAKKRAAKSFTAGWPTAWVHDHAEDPDWAGHVPTARLTIRDIWTEAIPPPDTAKVAIWKFWRERDRNSKTGWRYEYGPKTILLDELMWMLPFGFIVPVMVGKKGIVLLAEKGAVDIVDSCTYPGASRWQPTTLTPRKKETVQEFSRPCAHEGSSIIQCESIDEPLYPTPEPTSASAVNIRGIHVDWSTCRNCQQSICHPDSVARGLCMRCYGQQGGLRWRQ